MEMNNIKPKDRSERVCACIYIYINVIELI